MAREKSQAPIGPAISCGYSAPRLDESLNRQAVCVLSCRHAGIVLRDCFSLATEELSPVAENEKTSARVAQMASKALQNPKSVTPDEIQTLAASVLTQSPDQQQRQQGQQHLQNQQNQQNQQRK